jgi:hypothetical protein
MIEENTYRAKLRWKDGKRDPGYGMSEQVRISTPKVNNLKAIGK